MKLDLHLRPSIKIKSRWIIDLNEKTNYKWLLQVWEKIFMISERKEFLYKTQKALCIQKKIDTLTFKMKNFSIQDINKERNTQ